MLLDAEPVQARFLGYLLNLLGPVFINIIAMGVRWSSQLSPSLGGLSTLPELVNSMIAKYVSGGLYLRAGEGSPAA